jgi:hypothetical protein
MLIRYKCEACGGTGECPVSPVEEGETMRDVIKRYADFARRRHIRENLLCEADPIQISIPTCSRSTFDRVAAQLGGV